MYISLNHRKSGPAKTGPAPTPMLLYYTTCA